MLYQTFQVPYCVFFLDIYKVSRRYFFDLGWRAEVGPLDHPITNYEFDVIVGADGKRKTLKGERNKSFYCINLR